MIGNASLETANGTLPAGWQNNSWGTNSANFSYATTGHTGSRSAVVSMTSYTDGDAKWFTNPIAITGGHNYTYSDFYESGVTTHVVAAYTNATGTTTYVDLPDAAAGSNWKQYLTTFTAPASATNVTIYHLLSAVGSLALDDVSMTEGAVTAPTTIPNMSLEQVSNTNSSQPDQWTNNSWGTNTASFTYPANGHTGTHSIKVTVSNYKDGDAKWFFNPISTLKPGSQYKFSVWYKTNAQPHVVVMSLDKTGTATYLTQPTPLPAGDSSTTWHKYDSSFTVPSDSVSISAFMLMQGNGWVQTDDYDLTPYAPTGFKEPLVSLTFDDGWTNIHNNGLPLLKKYGFKSTQYIISGNVGTSGYMTKAQITDFKSQGSEIASHTITHPFLTQLTSGQLTTELQQSQKSLQSWFGTGQAKDFASPYGDYNKAVITQIKKYYTSHRSVDVGYNSKDDFDAYNLLVQNVTATTTPAQVAAWVAQAKSTNTWLILVFHQVENNVAAADTDAVSTAHLDTELASLKASGVPVKTIQAALTEVKSQL
jgi:peptidoglycan/xylan/chitin deacetylase (PgdA/CDA1 family)